ncbi:hypothetical protein HK097_001571 [Rhizophlyctis rosea]|uniref:Copper radical oxidase n=1 Tax=Rhizophlyctis rosea TaxID=64517 RepID=A0AAD5S6I7_9FUNG|nr:hypothetical protein HK097_001571 [Rhizophlyctis rosea]
MRAFSTATALAALAFAGAVSAQGEWNVIGDTSVVCIHTAQLPNGKLMCIERPRERPYAFNNHSNGRTVAEVGLLGEADKLGATQVSTKWYDSTPDVYANAFCGGHSLLGNGSVLVVGGDPRELVQARNGTILINEGLSAADLNGAQRFLVNGSSGLRLFSPCKPGQADCDVGTWSRLPDLTTRRWYPTVATLADGSAIIIGGSYNNINMDDPSGGRPEGNSNPTYEYYPKKTGAWPRKLDILEWAFPHSLYPIVFTMPSGKVFVFVSNKTSIIDPDADAKGTVLPKNLADMQFPEHAPWIYPHTPSAVVLPMTINNKWKFTIQVCGGSKTTYTSRGYNAGKVEDAAQPRAEVSADCRVISPEEGDNPQWQVGPTLPRGRLMGDNVILPDGKILYTNGAAWGQAGGNGGQAQYAAPPIFSTDLYDPEAPAGKEWTTLANSIVPRLYHSGALLMPSGHVITTGSEMNNWEDYWVDKNMNCWPLADTPCRDPFERRIEQFTPPYLQSKDPRPEIASVPASVTYKSTFQINMKSDGTQVDRITLTRYSSTTHQINTDQRFVELVIVGKTKDAVYVEAPSTGGIAPPGYWMLWALKGGIPSVAQTFTLANGAATNVTVPDGAAKGNRDGTAKPSGSGAEGLAGKVVALGVAVLVAGLLIR